ncbi:MAG: hypothetical protein SGI91_04455 [Alphaproteobacteria bacterium]|mgnify:CR=1 FL=1|nr:hypothetical protein [Alphaproteobacteria bacterium]
MAVLYGAYTTPRSTTPVGQVDGSVQGGHVRVYREKITLASQTTSDTIVVAYPSAGETFLYGTLRSDTSLGSSTVAIGVSGTTGKYRSAAVFTSTTAYETFGVVAAASAKLTTDETVFITIAAASLPASGTLFVDLYFAQT